MKVCCMNNESFGFFGMKRKSTEVDEVNEIARKTNGKIVSGIQTIKSISLSINHGVNFLWEYIFPSWLLITMFSESKFLLVEIKYVWFNYSYRHTWVMLSQLVVKTWPESVRNTRKWCRFLSYIGWIFPLSRTLTFIPLQNFFKLWNGQLSHKLNH